MRPRNTDTEEEALVSTLASIRRDLNEMVTAQLIASDSLLVKLNGQDVLAPTPPAEPSWNINATVAAYSDKQWRVTWTPSTAVNSYAELDYISSILGGTGYERLEYYPDVNDTATGSRSWIVAVSTTDNDVTVRMKLYVKSIDTGSISVVPL
jgi:hypothetical protein